MMSSTVIPTFSPFFSFSTSRRDKTPTHSPLSALATGTPLYLSRNSTTVGSSSSSSGVSVAAGAVMVVGAVAPLVGLVGTEVVQRVGRGGRLEKDSGDDRVAHGMSVVVLLCCARSLSLSLSAYSLLLLLLGVQ